MREGSGKMLLRRNGREGKETDAIIPFMYAFTHFDSWQNPFQMCSTTTSQAHWLLTMHVRAMHELNSAPTRLAIINELD